MNKIILIFLILLAQLPISEETYNQIEAKFKDNLVPKDITEKKESEKEDKENLSKFTIYPLPQKNAEKDIILGAKAYKAVDLETNEVMQTKNENEKVPIASLTKIMTAIVVLKNADLEEVVTVPKISNNPYEATMELVAGERIKIKELLHGLLIKSAGDAASALAITTYGSEEKFVFEMNVQAGLLGMNNTHFSNPIGLDDKDNYSTASEILTLSRFALSNKTFRETIQKREYTAKAETKQTHYLTNTNKLLDNSSVFGVKTGRTLAAGQCLITLAKRNNHEILTVVLNSYDRFSESRIFINWLFSSFSW